MKRLTFVLFCFTEQSWEQVSETNDWRDSHNAYTNFRQYVDLKNFPFSL